MEMIGKYIQERWKGFESKIKIKKRWAPLCCSFLSSFSLGCRPGPLLPLFIYSRAPRAALYHYEQFNLPSAYPLPLHSSLYSFKLMTVCCTAEQHTHTHTHEHPPSNSPKKKKKKKKGKKPPRLRSAPALSLPPPHSKPKENPPPPSTATARRPTSLPLLYYQVDSFPAPTPQYN